MSDWSKEIIGKLHDELKGSRDKDLRFFRLEEYMRMVERVDQFAPSCPECNHFKPQVEEQLKTIQNAIHSPGRSRRQYDRHIDQLARHMKKKHGFYPPFYFTYINSFYFTLATTGVTFLVSLLFPSIDHWYFVVPGFILGLLAGQFYGAKKDGKIRATKKIL
ncbi:MAG TPA: hypothetical protein VKA27_13075 [Sunxiuqinia sp.]|nr:hypothetical protein [Sunxiuqinia sp.]